MRAIVIDQPGEGSPCRVKTVDAPAPAADELLIRIARSSANWSDVQKREGWYPVPATYPLIPGLEVSGIVEDLGDEVSGFTKGQRVAAITAPKNSGGFAELCTAAARYAVPIPDWMTFETGAAFPVVALTAWHLINTAYDLQPGQRILIHACGGGVGLMLTQLARAKGATVYGTVSSDARAVKPLQLGAHAVINRQTDDFVAEVMRLTDGAGVDLVIDSIGADVLDKSFDALKPFGQVINIGEAGGYPDFDLRAALYRRSTRVAGYELLHAIDHSQHHHEGVAEVIEGLRTGTLELPIAARYPFEQAEEMLDAMKRGVAGGKLILDVADL